MRPAAGRTVSKPIRRQAHHRAVRRRSAAHQFEAVRHCRRSQQRVDDGIVVRGTWPRGFLPIDRASSTRAGRFSRNRRRPAQLAGVAAQPSTNRRSALVQPALSAGERSASMRPTRRFPAHAVPCRFGVDVIRRVRPMGLALSAFYLLRRRHPDHRRPCARGARGRCSCLSGAAIKRCRAVECHVYAPSIRSVCPRIIRCCTLAGPRRRTAMALTRRLDRTGRDYRPQEEKATRAGGSGSVGLEKAAGDATMEQVIALTTTKRAASAITRGTEPAPMMPPICPRQGDHPDEHPGPGRRARCCAVLEAPSRAAARKFGR